MIDPIQKDLNARYTYRRDRGEYWQILKGFGPVKGDCEDYSLTLIWLWSGRSMWRFWWGVLTFKYVLWHFEVNGDGHAALWVRGKGWTDNNERRIVQEFPETYRKKYPIIPPIVALKFLLRPLLKRR